EPTRNGLVVAGQLEEQLEWADLNRLERFPSVKARQAWQHIHLLLFCDWQLRVNIQVNVLDGDTPPGNRSRDAAGFGHVSVDRPVPQHGEKGTKPVFRTRQRFQRGNRTGVVDVFDGLEKPRSPSSPAQAVKEQAYRPTSHRLKAALKGDIQGRQER